MTNKLSGRLSGVVAAVPTAINAVGEPVRAPFLAHCRRMLENGCDGLNILGSTGEANSFSTEARRRVMAWAAQGLDRSRLMVGTGTPALAETISLTMTADDLGYPIALVLPPYYYKPASNAGLFAWYRAVHEALGDRPIQMFFYNYPQLTGIKIPVEVIAELASAYPERFTGIKDSSGDLDYCRAVVAASPELSVFPSSETALENGKQAGFAGCISATVNITAPLAQRLWHGENGLAPEVARQRSAIAAQPLIPAVKYLTGRESGDASWERVVPPFMELTAEQKAALDAAVGPMEAAA